MNIIAFVLKSILYYRRIERTVKPDAVMAASTYVLDIYPAWLIARKSGARLLYDLHDLWPLSPVTIRGYSRFHPFIIMIQMAENFACRQCDYFISVLGNAKDYLVKHGMKEEKFIAVPNGFSEEDYQEDDLKVPAEHEQLLKRLRSESRVIVGYAGGHAPSNALKSLIQAAKLSEDRKLAFVLVGSGSQKEELIRTSQELQCDHVFFLPPVPKKAIPDLLGYFDILYAGGVSSALHRYGTAFNKVTDYMLAGKPVVFAVDEPNSLIGQAGCGIQVPAENTEEIATAIKILADLGPEECSTMGAKGRDFAWRELGYSSIAKKILEATGGH